MAFSPAIEERICILGGSVTPTPKNAPMLERVRAIDLGAASPLLFKDCLDHVDVPQLAAIVAAADAAREAGPAAARALVTYPALEWDVQLFTPFTPGTPDHDEWDGTIDDVSLRTCIADSADEVLAATSPLTVIFLGWSEGWPNHFFVLAEDESDDPAVFTTDHEVYFSEVERRGTLLDLLKEMCTDDELLRAAREQYAEIQGRDKA